MVGREHKVIAVVDHHVERGVVIGATPSSSLAGGLVHDDACPARREAHCSGEPGKPGADHVDRARASDEGVTHDDPQQPRARQVNRSARLGPAAVDETIEDHAIGLGHNAWRAHERRGLRAMITSASAKCLRARSTTREQTFPSDGLARRSPDRSPVMPASRKASRRQIKPSDRRILIQVAQDVGQLQRTSQMVRERNAVPFIHSENADRQATDRARDPIAIEIERCVVGRADIGDDIHLHAIDDGVEILAPEPEIAHRGGETLRAGELVCRHKAHRYRRASA